MEFSSLVRTRKSVRSFLDKPVPRELIEKVIEVGTYAPTNCNQQLWNFTVVEDASIKEKLIKEAASSTLIRRVPVLVVVSYDGWNYKEALQGASLAVGHMLLAATDLGLGSLPMNSYGADTQVRRILNIPENQTICCFVLLGYPDDRAQAAPLVPRRNYKESIHWGQFDSKRQIPFTYDPDQWTKEDLINHQRFYCRKTVLGKEMDIMSTFERELVKKELSTLSGSVLDFMSYDGAYIREFPAGVKLTTVDLCPETAEYTQAVAKAAQKEISAKVLGDVGSLTHAASTLLYKLERIPVSVRKEIFSAAQGEFIIVARKSNPLLSLFFFAVKIVFGKDMRKTGIYTFFGPYKPISVGKTIDELRAAGFTDISWKGYFAIPTFFEQVYQMFLQYRASEGSSYLHREKRVNAITKLIAFLLKVQAFRNFGFLGSVAVIRCRK